MLAPVNSSDKCTIRMISHLLDQLNGEFHMNHSCMQTGYANLNSIERHNLLTAGSILRSVACPLER